MANLIVRELTEKRSLNSKHYLRDDGKFEAEIYQRPVHYLDDQGDLQDIVTDWETEDGFGQKVKKAKHHLRIFDGKLRFGFAPQVYVDYDLPGQLATTDNIAELVDAWSNTDLKYTAINTGVKGDIILKAPGHPGSFSFPVLAVNCEPVQEENTLTYYINDKVIGKIPAPYAKDAAGNIGPVTLTYENGSVIFTPDATWLSTAIYPVTIDPTTTDFEIAASGDDGYVSKQDTSYPPGGSVTVDTASGNVLVARNFSSPDYYVSNGLLKWDTSSIPDNVGISGASLVINVTGIADSNNRNFTGEWYNPSNWPIDASDYAETAVTTAFSLDITSVTSPGLNTIALTDAGSNILKTGYTALRLHIDGGSPISGNSIQFEAYDGAGTSEAILRVTYTAQPTVTQTSPNGTEGSPTTVTDEVTPNMVGDYNSADAVNMASRQHQVYDADDNLIYDSGQVNDVQAAGSTITVAVPSSAGLVYGTTYYWRWKAWDANGGVSDWSSDGYFVCELSAPTNLVATADAAGAEIGLAWDNHAGENLAGYRIYRKLPAAATWTQISTGIVVIASYDDELAASGTEYDYAVAAVATDGYESDKSATDTETVTFSGFWINDSLIKLKFPIEPSYTRRASSRVATDNSYITQDLGTLPRTASITIQFESLSERDTLIALFPQGAEFTYRDEQGETFRGKVVSTISTSRFRIPSSRGFYGTITFEAVEVTA